VIDGLLGLTRAGRMHLARRRVDVSRAARRVVAKLRAREPDRRVVVEIAEGLEAWADEALVAVVLDLLLGWEAAMGELESGAVAVGVEQDLDSG